MSGRIASGLRPGFPLILAALAGCMSETPEETDTVQIPEGTAPVLTHEPASESREGDDLSLTVSAVDPEGIAGVQGFSRTLGTTAWVPFDLKLGAEGWAGLLEGSSLRYPAVEYYFRAQDASDLRTPAYLPADYAVAPFQVPVRVLGRTLPFEESFDSTGNGGLYAVGWNESSEGFPGAPWGISSIHYYSGVAAAEHRRGADGVDPLIDWLISPALDLSGTTTAQVTWFESGDFAEEANHSLWISTSGPDPLRGGFEKVGDVPPPLEDDWARSPVFDLSSWAGASSVWLAWKYEGQHSDAWTIDDVRVRDLSPDLVASAVSLDMKVEPGESGHVVVEVTNVSTVATGPLAVQWDTAAAARFEFDSDLPSLSPGETVVVEADLFVDAEHPDNQWLPFELSIDDGRDSWNFADRLIVGDPSTLDVAVNLAGDGLLKLTLGAGAITAPTATRPVVATVTAAGVHAYSLDLSDWSATSPPGPGDARLWLKVEGAADVTLSRFELAYDGFDYVSDDLGTATAGLARWFYLPRPPAPTLVTASTSPTMVGPGTRVAWSLQLRNNGAPTTGATQVRLHSDDPDVVVVADEVSLGNDWTGLSSVNLNFDVVEGHRNSRPVRVEVEVVDEAESFRIPASIPVPWPVLQVSAIAIDDGASGDDDGLLDPGESAKLVLTLANVGGRSTFSGVTCDLAAAGTSTPFDVLTARDTFGVIAMGSRKVGNDYVIQASEGSVGDRLDLVLACTDGTSPYTVPFELTIGESPWLSLSTISDAPDDAVRDYGFDLVGGRYRVMDDELQVQLNSATPYDLSAVFLEAWMESLGAEYGYYQVIVQSGVGKLRGYKSAVTTLVSPTVESIDADTVQINIGLTSMGLMLDELSIGFAAGFCGGEDYYCDQFPDAWGNPFADAGFVSSAFLDLDW